MAATTPTNAVEIGPEVEKSLNDPREYRAIKLANNLHVVLVSAHDADVVCRQRTRSRTWQSSVSVYDRYTDRAAILIFAMFDRPQGRCSNECARWAL
jgi:hypothetical protein